MSTEIMQHSSPEQDLDQVKVLTIEDDPEVRKTIVEYLSQKGYATFEAVTGEAGLSLLAEVLPDLVLLDLRLPGMDGLEVLSHITKGAPEVPVIIVTGKGTVKDASDSLKLGAWDYITKPLFDLQILDISIKNVIERAKLKREKDQLQENIERELQKENSDLLLRTLELEKAYNKLNRQIEERRRAERAIQQERTFIQTIIDGVRDPARIISPDFRVLIMNQAALVLLPSKQTSLKEITCYEAYRQTDTPCSGENHHCVLKDVLETGKAATVHHKDILEDGTERVFQIEASALWNPDGTLHGILEVIRNITENLSVETQLRDHQERLYHLVHHDALTNLPNRMLLQDRLSRMMTKALRNKNYVAVLFLDLDRFKKINETLGHEIGDKMLLEVGRRIEACVRKSDTVARLGGDEFAVILDDLQDVKFVAVVARKILRALSKPVLIQNYELYATSSIGISLFPDDCDNVDGLLRCADTALYRAKDAGKNNYQYYTADMNTRAFEFLLLESGLRKALDNDELVVFYQPIISLENDKLVGMEALLRWQHPEKGMISPGDFIPLAEETGLIEPIGNWVLRAACTQNKKWQDAGYPPVKVAVNMSARQFNKKNIAEQISQVLNETGLSPEYLSLEITESVIMQDVATTISRLKELQSMGISLSLDDFGTGYSSLSYLKLFPINFLKIDSSFVFNITTDSTDAAISESVVLLAHSMDLKVVAEGVETEEQLEVLRQQGCDYVQGFLFSRPLSAEEFVPFFDLLLK
ncbi:MAG: EAL domain-containing protein [Desulfobulbales bacterium]|nr:EAL domain-containing protein [Desulfobulbales bacterium]